MLHLTDKVKIRDQEWKKYLVCGLGNPVLTDDAVGILLVRDLVEKCGDEFSNLIDFKECQIGFLDMLDDFSGYRHLLIIDSIVTDTEKPGTLILCEPEDSGGLSYRNTTSIHSLAFPALLQLGKMLGSLIPETCTIAGIAVSECKQFGIGLSPELKDKYTDLLYLLTRFIQKWTNTAERHAIINNHYKDMGKEYGK